MPGRVGKWPRWLSMPASCRLRPYPSAWVGERCRPSPAAEPTVSRLHAMLEMRDGRIVVRDLNSRFGTYVNGMPIRPERQR